MTQSYDPDRAGRGYVPGSTRPNIEMNTAVISPIDRIRWAAVLGGLFVALSSLVVLTLLGAAIGLSAYDTGDNARNYGIGAGIWGAISVLLAFFIGGWFAARSAAVRGSNNGTMNGLMVWAVAIPMMFYLLGGSLGAMMNRSGDADRVIHASIRSDESGQTTVDNVDRQEVLRTSRRATWGALISVVLGLGAAALGGYAGARGTDALRDRDVVRDRRDDTTTPPAV